MIHTSSTDKSIIVGLGKTGLSVAKYFAAQNKDFKVLDTRISPPGLDEFRSLFPDIEIETGELNKQSVLQAKELIISPGLSTKVPVIAEAKKR